MCCVCRPELPSPPVELVEKERKEFGSVEEKQVGMGVEVEVKQDKGSVESFGIDGKWRGYDGEDHRWLMGVRERG